MGERGNALSLISLVVSLEERGHGLIRRIGGKAQKIASGNPFGYVGGIQPATTLRGFFMRRASSHFWRVLPLIIIIFSFAAVLLFGEQGSEPSLEALIVGSSSDSAGVASSIEERDLPLALAASEIVKFRALHGEIPLTAKDAEEFRATLMRRMENAKSVSTIKTESCSVAVAARSLEIAGQKIDVPAHFTIPEGLIISSVYPADEAGTLIPDIRVTFFADAQLKEHAVTIDGKRVSPVTAGKNTLLYRPVVSAASALNVGTHTVSVVLQDVAGRIASKTWQFTVGVRPVPLEAPSQDAHEVGSFSLPLTSLGASATDGETLLVKVSEAPDGRTHISGVPFHDHLNFQY